jgi:hypothetical protein
MSADADTEQQTLSGAAAVCGRTRPRTLIRCYKCGDYILRSDRYDHEHDLHAMPWHRSVYKYAQAEVDG